MTALYSLNNHQDEEIAKEVAHGLKERGHQISIDIETLAPGQDWEAVLSEALQSSEVFVSLLTENSIRSQFVMTELGAAQAFRQTSKKMLVIPVVIGGVQIPLPIRNLQAIFAHEQDIPRIVEEINRAITAFIGQRAAEEKQQIEVKRRIESNAAVYIDDAIKSLGVQESRNRWMGNLWYYLGYATLVAGVGYGIYSITQYANANDQHWILFAYIGLKSIIIIGLLIACSRYAFTLGKSYMSEALKNADRIHAISFGRFYLRAFSEKADWAELKEVFQHWNINNNSAFSVLDADNFDPKFVEAIVEIAKALASKADTKK